MKISRKIDGKEVEIELTDDELYDAYLDKEFIFDKQGVEDTICGWSDQEVLEVYDVDRTKFLSLADDMAVEMRRNIDKYEMSCSYARDEAIADVLQHRFDAK